MRKLLYAVGLAGLVAIAVLAALLVIGAGDTSSRAAADSPTAPITPTPTSGGAVTFPTEVEATVVGSVTTADGQKVHLPETTISCPLVAVKNGPVYDCRGAWEGGAGTTSSATMVIGYLSVSGLPTHSWVTVTAGFGESFSRIPYVTLGTELTFGDYGHIENPSDPHSSRGVYRTYFFYRAYANGVGRVATEWIAVSN